MAFTKTAALNKLAQAVTGYIQAEQNYTKVAQAMHADRQTKLAFLEGLKGSLAGLMGGAAKPAPAPSHTGRNMAAIAALLGLGGAGAYAMHNKPGMSVQDMGADQLLKHFQGGVGEGPVDPHLMNQLVEAAQGKLRQATDSQLNLSGENSAVDPNQLMQRAIAGIHR